MGARKTSGADLPAMRPALTPEARENQMISLAMDLVEKRIREGTASSAETTHFLKLATSKTIRNVHANGHVYLQHPSYTVTVMTKTPDSDLTAAVSRLDQCRYDRSYIADNLYHDVFTMTA